VSASFPLTRRDSANGAQSRRSGNFAIERSSPPISSPRLSYIPASALTVGSVGAAIARHHLGCRMHYSSPAEHQQPRERFHPWEDRHETFLPDRSICGRAAEFPCSGASGAGAAAREEH
jgi:hypothetical protein